MKFEQWNIGGFERETAVSCCKKGVNPLVSVFMCSRGFTSKETIFEFTDDSPERLCDPFLLPDMNNAVARIHSAMEKGEKIAIFGDYDVDGMTASVLMATYFRNHNTETQIYIPGREEEGYGLNIPALRSLRDAGATLLITVDCGITGEQEALFCKEIGLDLIITDHHECGDTIPDAIAVVDPKRPDCDYPNKILSGAGVAFKLVCALEPDSDILSLLDRYSDLVALGTVADVMPVIGENRLLIRHGLKVLNRKGRPGLRHLMVAAGATQKNINTAAIGFTLSPRLNAAGRMGRASVSVEILMTEDESEAKRLTSELSELNLQRREIESVIFEQAVALIGDRVPRGPIILAKQGWYQGVMGIVSAKIAERYLLPAIIISIDENGVLHGSCRSFGSFKMFSALKECGDLLESYGGHEMAAGLTIRCGDTFCKGNITQELVDSCLSEFRDRITKYYHKTVSTLPVRTLNLDFEVTKPELISLENIEELEKIEPFGNAFPPPLMCIKGVRLLLLSPVGSGKHSRMRVEKNGSVFDCIFFSAVADDLGVSHGDTVDVAFEPQINDFRGSRNVQLHVLDIRKSSTSQGV